MAYVSWGEIDVFIFKMYKDIHLMFFLSFIFFFFRVGEQRTALSLIMN